VTAAGQLEIVVGATKSREAIGGTSNLSIYEQGCWIDHPELLKKFAVAVPDAIAGAGIACCSITKTLGAISENFCLPHRTS
jgi:hypothetical protein